ncbi:glycine--tRNA ligase subunit beta [Acidiphilium sp. C61]|jgi:glycyl-tRNA synthetase beta chain|uniref:glycine--tRNA ligase subunit beta n=1 Tax=Acidiphilium sp. C61 TaxID=1671485 RepID=UPI00157AED54|nr:glycine--tRNA ligase subunit beta [Acidiphilium sp. C61]
MAEFFLELFSEEIPARMQQAAAEQLAKLVGAQLAPLSPRDVRSFGAARRIAVTATIAAEVPASASELRGPKLGAPPQALEGFLRKNGAVREELVEEDGYFLLRRNLPSRPAGELIAGEFAQALAGFGWPKSMRWGQSGAFTWVRPLRRVVCLLDGAVVPFTLGPVASGDESEGHRFLAPGAFRVRSAAQWQEELRARFVIVDAGERRERIRAGLRAAAGEKGLGVAEDAGLLDEVAGLVEWPVCLIGAIDPGQMALPPEVRELSMKVNQRYFATRDAAGNPAPHFAFVANIAANDGGAAIIAGNERVLRARLADAEHFWAQDRKQRLDSWLPKLDAVTFHAKLGTQHARAGRIEALAREIARALGADQAAADAAARAGRLCKADLVSGMVGEFPELQGIMGGYYAASSGEGEAIAAAIRTHYQPKGPSDEVPSGVIAAAVALADKIDTLAGFFVIGEKPTGSGDPYALRRAALGVIRIVLVNRFALPLRQILDVAVERISESSFEAAEKTTDKAIAYAQSQNVPVGARLSARGRGTVLDPASGKQINSRVPEIFDFIIDRLRVLLRSEGKRFDVLNAVLDTAWDDDLTRLIARTEALGAFLASEDGANLLAAYRRSANILRIEDAKDGPHEGTIDPGLLAEAAEIALADALEAVDREAVRRLTDEDFAAAMRGFAALRAPVDAFFDHVTVNATSAELRRNRLRLLARLRDVMHRVADFSKLEG